MKICIIISKIQKYKDNIESENQMINLYYKLITMLQQMELEIDDLTKRDPSRSLKPLYLPIDPENEPKLYRKQDFNPPVFVKTTKGIEKVRPEGKFYFLLKFLPLELWYIIMEFKFVIEKYDFLDSVFYEQLEVESCAFSKSSDRKKNRNLRKRKRI